MLHSFRGRACGGFFSEKKPAVVFVKHVKGVCWTIPVPDGACPLKGLPVFGITSPGTSVSPNTPKHYYQLFWAYCQVSNQVCKRLSDMPIPVKNRVDFKNPVSYPPVNVPFSIRSEGRTPSLR